MVIAYLGLGANLGDREANLRAALEFLRESGEVEVLAVSRFVETEAMGGPSQPRYLNGAARIRTNLPPHDLLRLLQAAERKAGRRSTGVRWGPREADLDILLYGEVVVRTPELSIPHLLLAERPFVLGPLSELAPQVRDPISGKTIRELLLEMHRKSMGKKIARLVESLREMREFVSMAKRNRFTIGLVPTMGAFHEGHLSLIRAARAVSDKVVVSLFVNPTQFGASEDLNRYPRQLERDLAMASDVGADLVFAPATEEMYPTGGTKTWVTVEGISDVLCGAVRPGHFRGVATVVAKLFNIVQPDIAFFGQKDWQQTVVIRRLAKDLDFPVEIRVEPTVREADGLALSSRNIYLDDEERKRATCLWRGLSAAKAAFDAGERSAAALRGKVRDILDATWNVHPQYVEVVDADTLAPLAEVGTRAVVALAVRVGQTRLIDNILLEANP